MIDIKRFMKVAILLLVTIIIIAIIINLINDFLDNSTRGVLVLNNKLDSYMNK